MNGDYNESYTPRPIATQIPVVAELRIEYGVRFLPENVVSNYGEGDLARAAAEKTVSEWTNPAFPAELVQQTITPWTKVN